MDTGITIPAWSGRRRAEALAKVRARGLRDNLPCIICKQGIDYSLEYPHRQSCSVQHLKSRRDYPHLTWEPSNWEPAHLDCNKSAGATEGSGLGATSEEW